MTSSLVTISVIDSPVPDLRGVPDIFKEALAVREDLLDRMADLENDLAELVGVDSGSDNARGIGLMLDIMGRHLERLGFEVDCPSPSCGALVARHHAKLPGPKVLLVGHVDTVFGPGSATARPLVRAGSRLTGAGVADMKGGLALALHTLSSLIRRFDTPLLNGEIVIALSTDEEIGSPTGGPIIERAAEGAAAALVLEPARPGGELVLERKGMAQGQLTARGRTAHPGVDPERGRSALIALANAAIALEAMSDPSAGITCTVGSLHSGSRPNVVPSDAVLEFDLRAPDAQSFERGIRAIESIGASPAVPDVSIDIEWRGTYPPMSATVESRRLLAVARQVGTALGLPIRGVSTGGASDGNAIAALGIPVLDGLGPVGGGAHGPDEYVELDSLPDRGALLAGVLLALGRGHV